MPLQWLPLQQRQPMRSPVSEALTPRGVGGMTAGQRYAPGFVEREKARWAEEDKLRKMERDAKVKEAQEMGMRIRDAFEREKIGGRRMSAQAAAGAPGVAPTAAPLTKENMPETAKAMWDFILTLDEAGQKFFIQQLKKKEQPTGGFIEAGGVRKEMPGSVGMYGYLVDQGLLDPATDTVIERKPEEMKGRFSIEEGYIFDTTTGEKKKLSVDEPKKAIEEINKEANSYALQLAKTGEVSFEDAKYDYFVDNEVDPDLAKDLSIVKTIPKGDKGKNLIGRFINWLKGIKKTPIGAGMGAYREGAVTALIPQMEGIDILTATHYSHWEAEGATRAEIDEAFRRAKGEK